MTEKHGARVMELKKGDVFVCEAEDCQIEVEVKKGHVGKCDLVCCGKAMKKKAGK